MSERMKPKDNPKAPTLASQGSAATGHARHQVPDHRGHSARQSRSGSRTGRAISRRGVAADAPGAEAVAAAATPPLPASAPLDEEVAMADAADEPVVVGGGSTLSTLGALRAFKEATAGKSGSPPVAGLNVKSLKMITRAINQIEARLRDLEHAVFTTLFLEVAHPVATASLAAGKRHAEMVTKSKEEGRDGSEFGPPHLIIAADSLSALADMKLPQGADAGVHVRQVALKVLADQLDRAPADAAAPIPKHWRMRQLYIRDKAEPRVALAIHLEGTLTLPPPERLDEIKALLAAKKCKELDEVAKIMFVVEDAVPVAVGKQTPIGR